MVLYFGGEAVLSHRSAASLWGLLARRPGEVSITTVTKWRRQRAQLRLHKVSRLDRCDLRLREGLPLTSPARTVVDLAGEESDAELEEAVAVRRSARAGAPRGDRRGDRTA